MSKKAKQIILASIILSLLILITIAALPIIKYISTKEFADLLQEYVSKSGVWGVLVLLFVQMAQILIAFIPGEPIELVAGAMYGAFGGLVICLVGILISSSIIFYTVRRLGKKRFEKTKLYPSLKKYKFLENETNLIAIVFILYFIPGTPKDMLVYACALSNLSMKSFLIVSTFARIPSIVTSTLAGASFISGNLTLTLAVFAFTAVTAIIGILYHKKRFSQ